MGSANKVKLFLKLVPALGGKFSSWSRTSSRTVLILGQEVVGNSQVLQQLHKHLSYRNIQRNSSFAGQKGGGPGQEARDSRG